MRKADIFHGFMKDLDALSKIGFFVVLIVALGISWWSLFTLAMSLGIPMILSIGVSAAFDGAALFLAGITSKFARNGDNIFVSKTATYAMIFVSVFLNVLHAMNLSLGLSGMIMLGGSSLIAGVVFEVYLRYIHRQVLKDAGRVLDRLPLVGKVAVIFHPIISFRVLDKALRKRLYNGAVSVSDFDETNDIFKTRQIEKARPIKATATRIKTKDGEEDNKTRQIETVVVSGTKTKMKDMSIAKIVSHLMGQGIEDKVTIRHEVSRIKGKDISIGTINKTMSRITGNSKY